MADIIGRNLEVGYSVENVRGTSPATVEKWVKNVTAGIVEKAEVKDDESVHNTLSEGDQRRVVKLWIEGNLEGNVHADAIGYLFYNLYGAINSAVVETTAYDHTFTLAESISHASLSVYAKDGSIQQKAFSNCMVKALEIKCVVNDFVKYTAGFVGKASGASVASPVYNTEYDFIGKDITVKIADTEAGLPGATATKVKQVDIKFDSGAIQDFILGSATPNDVYNSKFSIEGKFVKNFDATTFKDLSLVDTPKYMSITILGDTTIGAISKPTLTFTFYKVMINSWTRSGKADAVVTEEVGFKAYYNATDSKQSKLILRNVTTEYATAPTV
jgi:hypothetical protein